MAMKYLDKYPKKFRGTGGIRPILRVLRTMIKTTLHRPVTILYPYEKEWIPDNYRGRPGLRFDRCIGCGICMRACPTTCITMVDAEDDDGKIVKRPQVNVGRCMMCGYCAEYCPVDAMTTTPDYELAEFTRKDMIYDPRRLAFEGTTEMMEVHLEEHLQSNLDKGIEDKPTAFFDTDRPVLDDDLCIGCSKCAKVCPTSAIEMVVVGQNAKGRDIKRPKLDSTKCVCCENCVIDCPKDALKIEEVL
ncbi:MAG: 4Fe-4S binding protein [Candidatus Methanomethylophilaceae archaeon]|jgi:NADH-quinone oxidoreductase subunit I|nr:formate hydrogenlyase [Methanomassiliicoccales archaeon RumEn M2]MDD3128675.1 4Fe-4S binding protein [Candidatus Methanomethylophilaceae archaeon]MDD4119064.1 4Fe-4S binding protein [Candidatus Methanomethylophilaceae archaeon]MDD4453899.1 4Fe-4S binding protein [Candidatus Methanomethylophilaceae archaeon]MDI9378669.1 4Fe-4S binding protein [Candidatus Thermoplasmatota archaeon]